MDLAKQKRDFESEKNKVAAMKINLQKVQKSFEEQLKDPTKS